MLGICKRRRDREELRESRTHEAGKIACTCAKSDAANYCKKEFEQVTKVKKDVQRRLENAKLPLSKAFSSSANTIDVELSCATLRKF